MGKAVERRDADLSSLSEKDDWRLYSLPGVRSCDKSSHKLRSIDAQPNHLKHWFKVERKRKLNTLLEETI